MFIDYGDILDSIAPALKNVNIVSLFPYLQSHHLVTEDEQYNLSNTIYTPTQKSGMLLKYLKHKGNGSLQKFLCCLNLAHEHTGHKDIADKLEQKLKDSDIECSDFCSDECKKRLPST